MLAVGLVAHQDEVQRLVTVAGGLLDPALHVAEALPAGDVVADDGADGVAVVAARDGLEALLARLREKEGTVSQICSLMLFLLTASVLAPNSTPMVTSCFSR